jgi:hypothetical protein
MEAHMFDTKLKFTLNGLVPSIMQSGRLVDPTYVWTRKVKEITDKTAKKRTDEDELNKLRYEFYGGLYMESGEGEDDGAPYWPAENLEAMVRSGAKAKRKGNDVLSGVIVEKGWPMIYKGPKTRCELWGDEKFRFIRNAKPPGARGTVVRARCIFPEWTLVFECLVDKEVINPKDVVAAMEYVGRHIGLGMWRRKYGLFSVDKVEVENGQGWTEFK